MNTTAISTPDTSCPLCQDNNEHVLWRNDRLRVILIDGTDFPGYTRVIWNKHVAEMTQLSAPARSEVMGIVWRVEQSQRDTLRPDKINLAQLGNMVAHLHWHIIPRWRNDTHFPEAIWATAATRSDAQQREWDARQGEIIDALPAYCALLKESLDSMLAPAR